MPPRARRSVQDVFVSVVVIVVVPLLSLPACDRSPSAGAPAASPAPARTPVPSSVAGPAAYDLAPADDGALLAWSPLLAEGGGVFVQRLDLAGVPRGPASRLAQTDAGGEVVELAASAVGARVGVAWVESSAGESRTRALLVARDDPAPPEPTRLSLAPRPHGRVRSTLALRAGRDGRLRVLHATTAEECGRGSSEPCTGYTWSTLGDDAAGAAGEWLRVPSPCADTPPLLGSAGSSLFYAVCTDADGRRETVAYGVDTATEYAHAVQALPGCTPLGLLSPVRGGAWLVGRCGERLRAAEITTDATRGVREHALDDLELSCAGGAPRLRAQATELRLEAPLDGLEAVLPEALAGEGSAAVWTGGALLIVRRRGAGLELGSYTCVDGTLRAGSAT